MKYGQINQRTKPEIVVLRGPLDQQTDNPSEDLPVKSGQTILSGQLITKEWVSANGRYEWVLGKTAQSEDDVFFARYDSASRDGSGLLTGLPCAGNYVLESAFFKSGETYADGVELTYDAATGNVKPVGADSVGDETVVGVVTQGTNSTAGLANLDGVNSGIVDPVNTNVIRFRTISRRAHDHADTA